MIGNCCVDVINIWWCSLRGMMPWSTSCSRVRLCWSLNCSTENRREIKCLRSPCLWRGHCRIFIYYNFSHSAVDELVHLRLGSQTDRFFDRDQNSINETKLSTCGSSKRASDPKPPRCFTPDAHLPLLSQSPFELFRPTELMFSNIYIQQVCHSSSQREFLCIQNVKVHYIFICVACVQNSNLFDFL